MTMVYKQENDPEGPRTEGDHQNHLEDDTPDDVDGALEEELRPTVLNGPRNLLGSPIRLASPRTRTLEESRPPRRVPLADLIPVPSLKTPNTSRSKELTAIAPDSTASTSETSNPVSPNEAPPSSSPRTRSNTSAWLASIPRRRNSDMGDGISSSNYQKAKGTMPVRTFMCQMMLSWMC